MRKRKIIFVCLLLIIFVSSCKVQKYINQKFPKVSTIDQQVNAIEENLMYLDSIDPSIAVYLNESVVNDFLPQEVKRVVKESDTDELIIDNFNPIISLEKQGVRVKANFSLTFPKDHVKLKGVMDGIITLSSVGDSLYLRTAFNSLKVKNISFTERPGLKKRAIAKLLVPTLKHFIERVNGVYLKKPSSVHLGWGTTLSFNPKELLGKNMTVEGDIVHTSRYLKKSSFLVDKSGISILIELGNQEETPVISEPTFTNNHSESQLNQKFKKLSNLYESKWENTFKKPTASSGVLVSIAKREVSSILNESLSKGFSLRKELVLDKVRFNSKVEVKQSRIKCNKVRTKFSYPSFDGDDCDWNCMKNIIVGKTNDPVCVAAREACKIKREAKRILWQQGREAARIKHQLENEAKVAACKLWKEAAGVCNLGRFKASVSGEGEGLMNFNYFWFNDDLSSFSFKGSGEINISTNTSLRLRPQDLGFVFLCQTNYDKKVKSLMNAKVKLQSTEIIIEPRKIDKNLELNLSFSPIRYSASLSPSPLHSFLSDPLMAAQCPVFWSLLSSGSIAATVADFFDKTDLDEKQKLLLYGQTKSEFVFPSITQRFKPMIFSIGADAEIESTIFWGEKSIDFIYTKE